MYQKYHISIYDQNCDIEKLQEKIELLIKSTLGENNLPRFMTSIMNHY